MHSLFLLADVACCALLLLLGAFVKEMVVNAADQMGSSPPAGSLSGCLPCTGLWITGETTAGCSSNQRAAAVWHLPVNLYLAFGASTEWV